MMRIKSCTLTLQRMEENSSEASLTLPVCFFAVLTIMPQARQEMAGAGGKRP